MDEQVISESDADKPRRTEPSHAPSSARNGGGRDAEPPDKRSRWPLIALGVVIVVAAIGAAIYWFLHRGQETTDDAYTDGRAVVISAKVGGYVAQLAVNDNQFVHEGDLLVQIEQKDYAAARDQAAGQMAAVAAQLDDARVSLAKAQTTYPAQLKQAQGQQLEAQGRLYQAQREFDRQHHIDRAATTQQSVDSAAANLKIAQGQVEVATAQVQQAELIRENIAQTQARVKQLEGQLQQARAAFEQAEINFGYTQVTAPHDGWVTRRNVEKGTLIQAGTLIMAIVQPEIWITANFKEQQLNRMRPNQTARIRVDAYPDLRLEGHVDSIQLGSGTRFSAFPPENATGNFVKIVQRVPVKIVIDRGLAPGFPLPLGLSVEPVVFVK